MHPFMEKYKRLPDKDKAMILDALVTAVAWGIGKIFDHRKRKHTKRIPVSSITRKDSE